MLLSNMFSNSFDDFVNSSNNKIVISRCQNRNATIPQLLATKKSSIADHSELRGEIKDTNEYY